nr:MAG TPA: hypothetical protein [Bacteriophage sp.]DAJ07016.1 MAG TPA: hypothetical protein [Caudoviricetes sp.]DAQ90508.1 MAG TPA: hypothetical protein [Caudoviricetes sp.]
MLLLYDKSREKTTQIVNKEMYLYLSLLHKTYVFI